MIAKPENKYRILCTLLICLLAATPLLGADGVTPPGWNAATGATGGIFALTAELSDNEVGERASLAIEFSFEGDSLTPGSHFEVVMPPEFDLSELDSISYGDGDSSNTDYLVEEYSLDGDMLLIELDTLGTAPYDSSAIAVTIYGIKNPQLVGSFRIALALLNKEGEWLAPPLWSPYFQIEPGLPANLELYPKGVQSVRAGNVIYFDVETSDQYGNILGTGDIAWSVIGAPVITGTIVDGVFQARKSGASRVVASNGLLADTSSLIYVLPGVFAYLSLSGGPSQATAGHPWSDGGANITIKAHDIFGNMIQDYEGDAYFTCTDPEATLPATEASPFHFTESDEGRHTFNGSAFTLFTAGRQDLRLVHEGEVQQTLAAITVVPDLVVDFEISLPEAVVAGDPFTVDALGAVDNWGNPVSAKVLVDLTSGDGFSPSGATPLLEPFLVSDGSGSVDLTLVNAELAELTFTLDSLSLTRETLVESASLERFAFDLDPVQVAGQPFYGTATLTALDSYGNVSTSFVAADDAVQITSSGTGTVFNNTINGFDSFANGVCDLTQLGIGYAGSEFFVTFTATSASGKMGTSPVVQFAAVKMTEVSPASQVKYIGESYRLLVTITNFGAQFTEVNEIRVWADGEMIQPDSIQPLLPDTVGPAAHVTYNVYGTVPDLPGQTLGYSVAFAGVFGTEPVRDSLDQAASLTILAPTGISVLSGTLAPTQATIGRDYEFSVAVRNESEDMLTLQTNTTLILEADDILTSFRLQSPTSIAADANPVELIFAPGTIQDVAPGPITSISLALQGTLGEIEYNETLPLNTSVLVQTRPSGSYIAGSLTPTTVYRGSQITLALDLLNSGTAVMQIQSGELGLYSAERLLVAKLATEIDELLSGANTLEFKSISLPGDWPDGFDSLTVEINGRSNLQNETIHLVMPGDLLAIPSGAAVRIVGVTMSAPNPPWVNVGQQFDLLVTVRNEGDEPLENISLSLQSDGASQFNFSRTVDYLGLGLDTTVSFAVEAALQPAVSELFRAAVNEATGASSHLVAQILPPANQTQNVVIQTPASLNLLAEITAPSEAQDRVVEPEAEFTITAVVLNTGQANVGSGKLALQLPEAAFSTSDELTREFAIGDEVSWVVRAPADPDTGAIVISLDSLPYDLNWDKPAKAIDSEEQLEIVVRDVQVEISVDFTAPNSPLLTAGNSHDVLSLEFDVLGKAEQPYLKHLDIMLKGRNGVMLDPVRVVESAYLIYNDEHNVTASFLADPERAHFELGAGYGLPESAVLTLAVRSSPQVEDFTLYLDSTSFAAAYESATGEKPAPVKADFASLLVIEQEFTLVPSLLDEAFFCYPNPFSPSREALKFSNPLPDKRAVLTIFALTGEEVLSKEIGSDVGEVFTWDGRNEAGNVVLNGVYIAVLTIDGVGEVRTKIAVVK